MKKSALSDIFGGLIILAIGLSLFLATNNFIARDKWWAFLLILLGVVFVFDAILRNLKLKEHLIGGRFITGILLFFLGLAFVFTLKNWWPLILILTGIIIILKGLMTPKDKIKSESTQKLD